MRIQKAFINGGPHHSGDEEVCLRCGRPVKDGAVVLELDQRTGEYHDFGGIPADESQGGFVFGPDCAAIMRLRATAAIAKAA